MITEVPDKSDFERSGIEFLTLSWIQVIELLYTHSECAAFTIDDDNTIAEKYWASAQGELSTAAALAQQGVELLIKGKIAEVSPFLIISGDPRDWPKGCDKSDTPFADFHTIEAQDLIRGHDAVCKSRLTNEFKRDFENLRRLRNSIFHTVDRRIKFKAEDVLRTIFFVSEALLGPYKWIETRRKHILDGPDWLPESYETAHYHAVRELSVVLNSLKPADLIRYIGFNPRHRRYLCCTCEMQCIDYDIRADCAQLVPNEPNSTVLHCFACGKDTTVVRKKCGIDGCKSNVIEAEDGYCCVCYEEHGPMTSE